MEISVTAWEKHKPQGTAGIRYPPKSHYTTEGLGLRVRRQERHAAALGVEPALEDKRGGKLVDFVAAGVGIGGIVTGGFESRVGLGGGEPLIPKVDGDAGSVCRCLGFGCGVGDQRFELIHKTVNALGLAAAIAGEVQRIAGDDAGAAVAARKPEDGSLIATGLGALDGEQRLRDAQQVRERDTDPPRADIEAEPGLELTEKWHCGHALMIVREGRGEGYNRSNALSLIREGI
jgi:hypothetical protein